MSNWILHASDDWLKPVYDKLHAELVRSGILHADEATLQVLREPGKSASSKSYMWLYRTGGDAEHPIVLFDYRPNRKAEDGSSSWPVSPAGCMRMAMKAITGCRNGSGSSGVWRIPGASLTRR